MALLLSMEGDHGVRIAVLEPLALAAPRRSIGCDHDGGNRIRRVVRRRINQIKNCYELELQKHHGLAGRVVVRFSVKPNGSVRAATVAGSTVGNETVEACMVAVVRRWRFPEIPERGGAVVSYPFVLTPRDTAQNKE
jgi:TonB family protein